MLDPLILVHDDPVLHKQIVHSLIVHFLAYPCQFRITKRLGLPLPILGLEQGDLILVSHQNITLVGHKLDRVYLGWKDNLPNQLLGCIPNLDFACHVRCHEQARFEIDIKPCNIGFMVLFFWKLEAHHLLFIRHYLLSPEIPLLV